MWIFLMLLGAVLSTLADEVGNLGVYGGLSMKDYLPKPGYLSHGFRCENTDDKLSDLFPEDNKFYTEFNNYVEKGVTKKGLTFNIYDDNLREATIAFYNLLKITKRSDKNNFNKLKKWAKCHVNNDILDYVLRLISLFNVPDPGDKFLPPFINKPNYFISGETIYKALSYQLNYDNTNDNVKKVYQILNEDEDTVVINTNYSTCNIVPLKACIAEIKYFTEDIALNSYYYGLHLLHPFWMPDDELNEVNPEHAAHYYYAHQQLYARYSLEEEHIDSEASLIRPFETKVTPDYQPYLFYENGLSFPTRTSILGRNIRKDVTYLQTIDIAITEVIQKGIVQAENGTIIRMTDDNYMELLPKYLRSQIDSTKVAKIIRSAFGYANNGYPIDKYNPAPSVMHHPQTALRDPVYWYLIRRKIIYYFLLYTNSTDNYDISKYERNEFTINDITVSKISTTYKYYLVNLYKSLACDRPKHISKTKFHIFARQKRLTHNPVVINFSVDSKSMQDVVIRIFIGPRCSIGNCWEMHYRFFQLDCYHHKLTEGSNNLTWTLDQSSRFSSDDNFNKSIINDNFDENYDIYKFPKNLVIPKGREDGLNLTLFVMILDEEKNDSKSKYSTLYMQVTKDIGNKPLGFPFHKQADINTVSENAPNYRFFNITVFHSKSSPDVTGYFSPDLY